MKWLLLISILLCAGPVAAVALGEVDFSHHWRTGSRESTGLAPDPAATPEAVVQVYCARALGWRGIFGVHSWIVVKPAGAAQYVVYEVFGWRAYHGMPALMISNRTPDGRWFGYQPRILADLRGESAEASIPAIKAAALSYPYADDYRVWPGPNSNSFTAYVARRTPGLKLDLPPTAVGKDYLEPGRIVAPTPSGTGYQISLYGVLGVLAGIEEGLEINLFGLVFGADPIDLAIKLPGIGRLALRDG